MFEIDDELNKKLKEWSEGNEYLYSLLYLSWQHGIRTSACCGGHAEHKDSYPYILFIVDEKNLLFFESMISAIENIPDVSARVYYRNQPNIPQDSKIVFGVECMMHNRMETFNNLAHSILEKKAPNTPKGQKFYQSLIELLHTEKSIIEKDIADGLAVESVFTTYTSEREKYLQDKKKLLYKFKKILTQKRSKYDNNQEKIAEAPYVGFSRK